MIVDLRAIAPRLLEWFEFSVTVKCVSMRFVGSGIPLSVLAIERTT